MSYISSLVRRPLPFIIAALTVAALSVGFAASRSHAADTDRPKPTPATVGNRPEEKVTAVTDSFKHDFPNFKFTQILESEIEGLYEVIMNENIVYYSPAAHKVIAGDMFNAGGKNITAQKREILRTVQEAETAKLIDTLPLDKAIKIGTGKNIVIEFTDVDCPYCRKVEAFFKNRNDITRYIFLYPLEQLHPMSLTKSREVLCSKDPAKAYKAAMDGELDKTDLKGCGGKEQEVDRILTEYKTTGDKLGVSGTPMMWVNKKQVNGANSQKIEEYLAPGMAGTAAPL